MTDEQKQDNAILTVAPDSSEGLLKMVERISGEDGVRPDFLFLSDLDLRVIRRYGIFNPDGAGGGRYQVPHPATYVIDKQGVVRWASVDVDYSVRPSNEDVWAALAALR